MKFIFSVDEMKQIAEILQVHSNKIEEEAEKISLLGFAKEF